MGRCVNCGGESEAISAYVGLCVSCMYTDFESVLPRIREVHRRSRELFDLPAEPPHAATGVRRELCVNEAHRLKGRPGTAACESGAVPDSWAPARRTAA